MKQNGKATAMQANPVIRETRRELKEKLSEIEELIFDKLHAIKVARVEGLEQELALKTSIIDGLKDDKKTLLASLMANSQKLHQLEKENARLESELLKSKTITPGRKYSALDIKKAIVATLIEANNVLQWREGKDLPIVPVDKMGLFIFQVCQDPDEMVPVAFKNYWGGDK